MEKNCLLCQQNIITLDYKNTEFLRQFLTGQAKILPSKRSGTCNKHQRLVSSSIKRARFMALLPFTSR
ncbi:MAG: 30S ribosomal protein S18 [Candidatus Portnoybacteria bacterium CG10_big_fil_rev_8_21_14_0_10_36_7]|uniref:Small ribosomal subunit protein bS18 n=1 Tax=Candidatus Portnoybacteria bacterium CG10_big_fil_rev_8_21_14_0_10_36_7 TaxID=1974812 RepID=A0A2M8KDH1_9BACT|nr:MAG: 30S ribosomal protein S18 [Candidatus Portnoybacteria bacterium CG10_big_fil_rev_8_21_14_0_10_36_7]